MHNLVAVERGHVDESYGQEGTLPKQFAVSDSREGGKPGHEGSDGMQNK